MGTELFPTGAEARTVTANALPTDPRPTPPGLDLPTGRCTAIGLALLAAVAGCLGGPDADPATEPTPSNASDATQMPLASTSDPAIVRTGSPSSPADWPDWVPEPTGEARYTGSEAFEPTIGTTADGAILMENLVAKGAPGDEPGDSLQDQNLLRSTDDGRTWTDVTPKVGGTNVTVGALTMDPYLHVDPTTGRIFQLDLQALSCSTLSFSDDGGGSWSTNPLGCGQPPVIQDHPTLFTGPPSETETLGYPNVVYYCVNRIADAACSRSLDGGATFGPLRPLVFEGVRERGTDRLPSPCYGNTGHGVTGPNGTVYLARACDDRPEVAVSTDDGLTWHRTRISPDHTVLTHEVSLATDRAGNVYAVWVSEDDRDTYLAASGDRGRTWSTPAKVSPPSVATTAFSTVAAGDPGRVAVAYYGTNATADAGEDGDRAPADARWNGYLSIGLDATEGRALTATVPVHHPRDPIAKGPCNGFNRCENDGLAEVGDFIDVTIGPEGRPWAALVDVCEQACRQGAPEDTARGLLGTLAEGPSLRGPLEPLAPLEASSTGHDAPRPTDARDPSGASEALDAEDPPGAGP